MWAGLYLDFPEVFEDQPNKPPRERRPDRYGHWGSLVRELSDGDHEKAKRILKWPLREALHAYRSRMKAQALNDYQFEMTLWALLAPHAGRKAPRQPPLPRNLKDSTRGDS